MKLSLTCALLLSVAAFSARAEPLPDYEFQVVAPSQANSPDADLDDPRTAGLAAALAAGRMPDLPDRDQRIAALSAAGLLIRKPDGGYAPTFPIIDRAAGKAFAAIDPALADRMAKMVESHAASLKTLAPDLPLLMLFSDIPFDRWQVRNVRSQFLGGYPPPRGGKEFYAADVETGAADFYSHGEEADGDLTLVTYGNGPSPDAKKLLADYRAGKLSLPVMKRSAYARLPEAASTLTADLVALLEADRPVLEAAYRASPLSATTSFREFGLWWYHFLYAEATARLIQDKLIPAPPAEGAALVVVPD